MYVKRLADNTHELFTLIEEFTSHMLLFQPYHNSCFENGPLLTTTNYF